MVHGLHLNLDFSAFCAAFFCFYFGSDADLRKIWYAAFLCAHNGISQEWQRVLRDDPAESQQFHVWVKVSFPSVISHRKLERKSCRWSSSWLEPCWRESDACSLQPCCCIKQTYTVCFRAIWLEDLAAVLAGPGFRIWFLAGFGAKKRGSLFACLCQRGGFGGVTGLFEMEAFIFFCISWLHVQTGLQVTSHRTTVWKDKRRSRLKRCDNPLSAGEWCTYDLLCFLFYELAPK